MTGQSYNVHSKADLSHVCGTTSCFNIAQHAHQHDVSVHAEWVSAGAQEQTVRQASSAILYICSITNLMCSMVEADHAAG